MKQDKAFKAWWYSEGSQPPYTHHDCEEHTMRMCEIAWANGADKEKERIIKVIERLGTWAHISEVVSEIKGEQA